jgi:hypothetical protein
VQNNVQDFIIVDNDVVTFEPQAPLNCFVVTTTIPAGASKTKCIQILSCILGDEKKVKLNTGYTSGAFSTPGMGVLEISSLNSDQITKVSKIDLTPIILLGTKFNAKFTVQAPAKTSDSKPDPMSTYTLKGHFTNSNKKVLAS